MLAWAEVVLPFHAIPQICFPQGLLVSGDGRAPLFIAEV